MQLVGLIRQGVYICVGLTHACSHGGTVRMMYKITTRICRYDKDVKMCVCVCVCVVWCSVF